MNVYDFDKTIYKKDSTIQFYLFCLKRNIFLIRYIFIQAWYYFLYIFCFINKTKFKQGFFVFLKGINDIDGAVNKFWQKNKNFINKWYLNQKKESDIIISASPEFLLLPICNLLGVKNLIASIVDKRTGVFLSENCYGEEKVKRLKVDLNVCKIDSFYSDSLSDLPLSEIAKQSYIVKKENLIPWEKYKPSLIKKIKAIFTSKEFIGFLVVGLINALNGVLFATIFSLFLNPNIAFVVGYIISLTISYILNSILVFKNSLGFYKYFKFCISYIPNFLIQNGLVYLFYNVLGLNKILVYAIAVILAVPITFIALKFFTFTKSKQK